MRASELEPLLHGLAIRLFDGVPAVAGSVGGNVTHPRERKMGRRNHHTVASEAGERGFPHGARLVLANIESDRHVGAWKLNRAGVDDIADEDDTLPLAGQGVEGGARGVPRLQFGTNARHDFAIGIDRLHPAGRDIGRQRLLGLGPEALVDPAFGRVGNIGEKRISAPPA